MDKINHLFSVEVNTHKNNSIKMFRINPVVCRKIEGLIQCRNQSINISRITTDDVNGSSPLLILLAKNDKNISININIDE